RERVPEVDHARAGEDRCNGVLPRRRAHRGPQGLHVPPLLPGATAGRSRQNAGRARRRASRGDRVSARRADRRVVTDPYPPIARWVIPDAARDATLWGLRRAGLRGCEGGALWLGDRASDARVRTVATAVGDGVLERPGSWSLP